MSHLIACPSCRAAVPQGAFCSVCGSSLTGATPVAAPAALEPAVFAPTILATPTAAPASSGWIRRNPAVALGVLVLGGAGLWFAQGSDHTIDGEISIVDSDYYSADEGDSCTTSSGYSDIVTGGQVVVTDEDGTVLATSSLRAGTVDSGLCTFPFSIEDVGGAEYYEVSTGNSNRGGPKYSADELEAQDWTVHLSLGD